MRIELVTEPREAEWNVTLSQRELDFIVWSLGERSTVEAGRFELEAAEFNEMHDSLLDKAGQIVPREDVT